jgi:PHP family Zn ribbon phosphoesterase
LAEIIAETLDMGVASKAVNRIYWNMIQKLGNEFSILMDAPLDTIERAGSMLIREAISRVRAGNVRIAPGYDGEYGTIKIFEGEERKEHKGQATLF